MVSNVGLTVINDPLRAIVTWASTSGAFDLRHYSVKLCSITTTVCTNPMVTNNTSIEIEFSSFDVSDMIQATVFAESQCDDIGNSGMSNQTVIPESSTSCKCKNNCSCSNFFFTQLP